MIENKKYNYQQIVNLMKSRDIEKKIVSKTQNPHIDFYGKNIEYLLLDFQNLKNFIGVIADYHFSIAMKFNLNLPININCDLESIVNSYKNIPQKNQNYPLSNLHEITNKKHEYFDLCFYTLQHFKTADFIGFPGYEFHESEKFIDQYMDNNKKFFFLHPKLI